MTLHFDRLVLDRDIACSPSRLFHLMTDPGARAEWGKPDDESVIEIDHADIRPGGQERARCGPKDDPHFNTVTDFHALETDTLLLSTEALTVGGTLLSVAQIAQELAATDTGCRLTTTLQIASLAGPDVISEHRGGWSAALDNLAALAASAD